MFTEIEVLRTYMMMLWGQLQAPKHDERGAIEQTVILVALFAAAAIAIATIIVTKFTDKANTIPTE